MMYSGDQVLQLLSHKRAEVVHTLERADHALAHHQRVHGELEGQYQRAAADLGSTLLPWFSREHVAWAAQVAGYGPFAHEDVVAAMEAERAQLQARLAQIEAEEDFRDRELLRHPRTGTLTTRRAELVEHVTPWAAVLDTASHPRLDRLLEVGYGTPEYAVPFWRLSYYSDWEAGDELLERFPGKTFAEIRAEVLRARETVPELQRAIADVDARIGRGMALENEHAMATQALATLVDRHLHAARVRLVDHLLSVDPKHVAPRFAQYPELQLLFLRASGIVAKRRYLDAVVNEHVGKLKQSLLPQLQKLDRDLVKFQRPKKRYAQWPAAVIDRRVQSRRDRYDKVFNRFEGTYTTIYVYDDWDRARRYDDFLWWHLMTDRRWNGSYIPEVTHFEHTHPEWQSGPPSVDELDDGSAAAAAIAADRDLGGGAYGVDAS